MGIYDREYYRGESGGPSWIWNLTPVCKWIILINAFVFLILQRGLHWDETGFTAEWLAASPEFTLRHFRFWQLLTAAFCHANPMHIVFNMMFFWFVGREMEQLYGSRDFLVFYLSAAVLSMLAWVLIKAFEFRGLPFPDSFPHAIGASGAVLATVMLFAMYYPKREIYFFFFVPMPMWMLVAIDLVVPLLPLVGIQVGMPNVAVEAHLAGMAYAALFKQFDLRWSRLTSGRAFRPKLRIFSPVSYDQARPRTPSPARTSTSVGGAGKTPSVSVLPEEQLDARLDEVLAKIAREGRAGLTEEEQRVLQEASRRARIRRSDRP
ncbi:MAG: rhomboid family intramembrane serine protease [Isosphaeraceae bacterium]